MCAIVGIWNLDGKSVDNKVLRKFTGSLAHRGPDGTGTYLDKNLGLGNQRLAITGASSGHQPLSQKNGRYWITYNGEIYNFDLIRKDLQLRGVPFSTQSDTEVVLNAFVQWGPDCLLKFNGMWAFAIWDSLERQLFLARDRFGIKPLFYCLEKTRFAFASELKAFLSLPDFNLNFDPEFITDELASFASSDATENTFLKEVKRLSAGHYLILKSGRSPCIHRWWNTLDHLEKVESRFEAQAEQFRELFTDACRIAAPRQASFGTTLSGGVDSNSVLFTLNHLFRKSSPNSTYSRIALHSYFPDSDIDERKFAFMGAREAGVDIRINSICGEDAVSNLEAAIYSYESLKGCPSARWLTYREIARTGLKVVLEGEGADELLAGYLHHPLHAVRGATLPFPRLARIREYLAVRSALEGCPRRGTIFSGLRTASTLEVQRRLGELCARVERCLNGTPFAGRAWEILHRYVRPRRHHFTWLKRDPRPFYFPSFEEDRKKWERFGSLNRQLHWDFHYGLLPGIVRSIDRCSMAHGVEVRSPFLDWRLVCFAFSLPGESKIGAGRSKRVLRAAMRDRVPAPLIRKMTKIPFQSPVGSWLKGPARDYFLSHLNSRPFLDSSIWRGPRIRNSIEKSLKRGDLSLALPGWSYVQTMRLMELFKEKQISKNE